MKLDEALRTKLIDTAVAVLDKEYLFPQHVAKIEKKLRGAAYDGIRSPDKLAKQLTDDINAVTKDESIFIRYSEEPVPDDGDSKMTADERARMRTHAAQYNSFIDKVERLPGNIGYIRINAIVHVMVTSAPFAAAMAFIADTEELIIDLRGTAGGDPAAVALMVSYFTEAGDPVHVSDVYTRATDSTRQYWTVDVAGPRYRKPVYVLVNGETGFCAEELAFTLQALKRAKIVGETTAGRAYHYRRRRLAPNFALFMPLGRSISALSKKGWDGAGVKPDIKSPEAKALEAAHVAALKAVRKRTNPKQMPKDFVPNYSDELDRVLAKKAKR
jgi:C-terminal processing protease CtpA/Prc